MISWQTTSKDSLTNSKRNGVLARLTTAQINDNTTRGSTPGLINPNLGPTSARIPVPTPRRGQGVPHPRRKNAVIEQSDSENDSEDESEDSLEDNAEDNSEDASEDDSQNNSEVESTTNSEEASENSTLVPDSGTPGNLEDGHSTSSESSEGDADDQTYRDSDSVGETFLGQSVGALIDRENPFTDIETYSGGHHRHLIPALHYPAVSEVIDTVVPSPEEDLYDYLVTTEGDIRQVPRWMPTKNHAANDTTFQCGYATQDPVCGFHSILCWYVLTHREQMSTITAGSSSTVATNTIAQMTGHVAGFDGYPAARLSHRAAAAAMITTQTDILTEDANPFWYDNMGVPNAKRKRTASEDGAEGFLTKKTQSYNDDSLVSWIASISKTGS